MSNHGFYLADISAVDLDSDDDSLIQTSSLQNLRMTSTPVHPGLAPIRQPGVPAVSQKMGDPTATRHRGEHLLAREGGSPRAPQLASR